MEPLYISKISAKKSGIERKILDTNKIISATYAELSTMVTNEALIPGQMYRITDYVTTVKSTETDVQSAGHQFDIIVTAQSSTDFFGQAKAALHDGDTYFASSDLSKWELGYKFKATAKYSWADPDNSKGVIYYMKDDRGNSAPYDFKNIMFRRYKASNASFVQNTFMNTAPANAETTAITSSITRTLDGMWAFYSAGSKIFDLIQVEPDTSDSIFLYTWSSLTVVDGAPNCVDLSISGASNVHINLGDDFPNTQNLPNIVTVSYPPNTSSPYRPAYTNIRLSGSNVTLYSNIQKLSSVDINGSESVFVHNATSSQTLKVGGSFSHCLIINSEVYSHPLLTSCTFYACAAITAVCDASNLTMSNIDEGIVMGSSLYAYGGVSGTHSKFTDFAAPSDIQGNVRYPVVVRLPENGTTSSGNHQNLTYTSA